MNGKRTIFTVILLLGLSQALALYGAELLKQIHPSISLKEEYNDNLKLTSTNQLSDYVTTIQPGIKFSNMDQVSGLDLNYLLGVVMYGKNSDLNYISHSGSLSAKYMTAGHVNFYLKESLTRSEESREREPFTTAEDNKYLPATTRDAAIYWRNVLAPTVEYQFGPENRLGVNYRNNIYQTQSAGGENSKENTINPFLSYWFDKQNGISLDYGLTYGEFDKSPDLTGHRVNTRYTNRFNPKSSAFAEYAFSRQTFESPGVGYDIHEPGVGMTYAFTPVSTASLQAGYFWKEMETGKKTEGFTYKGALNNLDQRTAYQLSLQGGYSVDYFTSENLGFHRYSRITASATHRPGQRTSLNVTGSVERGDYESDRSDTISGISGSVSHTPLKWLTLSLELGYKRNQSNAAAFEYSQTRGLFSLTATY